ncbi:VWA domain-containing protein [Nocardia sp. CA-107356]|uniref:VWA domain-containing protein n=1 Tax=Nocardia sp. CA-107356 TaxID=3239972 RepID=UPI003D8AF926
MSTRLSRTIAELTRKAGQWLGLTDPPPRHDHVVVGDRFDDDAWTKTRSEATALTDLESELTAQLPHATDLLRDLFVLAIKHSATLRDCDDIEASRVPHHAIIDAIVRTPEFAQLHRHTVGDRYASAMAVLAQAPIIREMLDNHSTDAMTAADTADQQQQAAAAAAAAVADALVQASAASIDDVVPADLSTAVEGAVEAAEAAHRAAEDAHADATVAAAALGAALRAPLRAAAAEAATAARAERTLMDAWQISPDRLQRMSFDERTRLAQRLRSGRIGDYAELIGRFRMVAGAQDASRSDHGHDELAGVTRGDDLSRLVPGELTALAVPALRAQFAARYADAALNLYEIVGDAPQGLGAIIAVIDCSHSMSWTHPGPGGKPVSREAWAKACALALLDQARRHDRDFVAVLFSSPGDLDVFRFPAAEPAPLDRVLDMTDCFHDNGTDFKPPLTAAADIIAEQYNTRHTPRGDIVLITDGEDKVDDKWLCDWSARRSALGFRVFGISIKTQPSHTLTTLCDNLRIVDELTPTAAAELFHTI